MLLEKSRGKLPTSIGSLEKQENSKKIYFCFIDYAKAFDCVDHNKLWKILQEMGLADHLTCLLRNLYAGQEATVRTGHGRTNLFVSLHMVCRLISNNANGDVWPLPLSVSLNLIPVTTQAPAASLPNPWVCTPLALVSTDPYSGT